MTFNVANMEQTCSAFVNFYELMHKKDLFAKDEGRYEVEAWINVSRVRYE